MKIQIYILVIFFFACIDIITDDLIYNSLLFSGGSWIELEQLNKMKINDQSNNFSLQLLIAGNGENINEAPALFSITDENGKIILSLLRDPNMNNKIITIVNSKIGEINMDNLDFSNSDKFYLITLQFSNNNSVKAYIDSTSYDLEGGEINFSSETLIIGAIANQQRTILENFWHGYIDEIRLWNTHLADSTITFQSRNPHKLGDHYRYTNSYGEEIPSYLDSLLGIWRLNYKDPQIVIEDESNNNNGYIYTLDGYSIELSEKGAKIY